ncbi:hypothetical protein EC973_003515 [Apophysomyces ossiformis]|uniref:Uncharacterized protein n=1 Tax=Apophysomyces ossiformis TaxID=679940 RepID=A0A8H7BH58_9FUNG|nr:hypothetical protein EC973_003515 [Apophysomyces ossiformis]
MDEYPGVKGEKARLKKFVGENQGNLVKWSLDIAANNAAALHGVWFERYKKALKFSKPKYAKPKKPTYNNIIWNQVMSRVMTQRRLRYLEGSLTLLGDISTMATGTARELLARDAERTTSDFHGRSDDEDEESENDDEHISDDDDDEEESDYEDNVVLATLAMRKLSNQFEPSDMDKLKSLVKNGDDVVSRANDHVVKLLSQEHLTEIDEETIKLLLSNAINLLDHTLYASMANVFSQGQLKDLVGKKQSWIGMDLVTRAEINQILDNNSARTDDLLVAIQSKKIELIKKKENNSELYNILLVLELVIEYITIPVKDAASETTCYRRFAMLLDFVFKGLKLELKDGDVVSEATQKVMEQNNYDELNGFGRKIDVLINLEDSNIALNSNEWKSKKAESMKLKQQSKNIRSNCAILNNLYITSQGDIKSIMAMDVIGMVGYLYLLKLKKGVYVATLVGTVFVPCALSELDAFKDTIDTLFIWRNFMKDQIKTIRNAKLKTELASTAVDLHSNEYETTALPAIFFTPKHKQATRKRTFNEADL